MIKKEAIEKARYIPSEEHHAKAFENLRATTKIFNDNSKALEQELKIANKAFSIIIESAPKEHQQQIQSTVIKAKKLIEQLKKGANQDDIIKQIKDLQNGC